MIRVREFAAAHVSPTRAQRTAVSAVVIGCILLASTPLLDGGPSRSIHVRWRADVGAIERTALETWFGLRAQRSDGRSFAYDLLDDSPPNIRALLDHPAVEDTHDLDRERGTVSPTAGVGDSRTGVLWRWRLDGALPWLKGIAIALIAAGTIVGLVPLLVLSFKWTWPRVSTWFSFGLPVLGAWGFGAFRVALSLMLGIFLWYSDLGSTPYERLRFSFAFPGEHWIQRLAAIPGAVDVLERILCAALIAFGAGLMSRVAYAIVTLGFTLHFCVWSLSFGQHPLGPLPLALPLLLIVPWNEGVGIDWWRCGTPPRPSRVPPGYALRILCVALGVALAAAAFAKLRFGVDWVINGSVRYDFMSDALTVALVPWGPWIAARPGLSVFLSGAVVFAEATMLVAAIARPSLRLLFALIAAGLFVGFALFHGAVWPAWWVLATGLLPWEWIDAGVSRSGVAIPLQRRRMPAAALVLTLLLIGQQVVVSRQELEFGPFFSAYDMYSTTYPSPEAFERANGGPRFAMLAYTAEGTVNVEDCVLRDPGAMAEMVAAVDDPVRAATGLEMAREAVMRCAAMLPGASRFEIRARQPAFDWVEGRAWYRYQNRLIVAWRLERATPVEEPEGRAATRDLR